MRLQKTFEQLVTAVEEAADEAMMELELHVNPAESPKKMNQRQAADVARAKKYLMGRYSWNAAAVEADIKAEKPAALSKRLVTDNMETAMANSDPDNFSEEAYFVSFCSYCSLIFFSLV